MCYLVAKDRDAHGCFALKTTHGKHLVELKRELNQAVGYQGVQLVTISRPTAYIPGGARPREERINKF